MELITFQSKARHQIMIELRESQQLLKEATSEKAVKFWNHHIDVLLNKLDAIDQEKEEENHGGAMMIVLLVIIVIIIVGLIKGVLILHTQMRIL